MQDRNRELEQQPLIDITSQIASQTPDQHWLIWDGGCSFCRECVAWVQERDHRRVFILIAYQVAPTPPMTAELREKSRDALQVVTSDGDTLSAGIACAFVLEKTGYVKLGRLMRLRLLRPLVEWGYRRVANNRDFVGRLVFGKKCSLK
jgi:predicted DCC family thiol-disulfide oxidoreductase YuxK